MQYNKSQILKLAWTVKKSLSIPFARALKWAWRLTKAGGVTARAEELRALMLEKASQAGSRKSLVDVVLWIGKHAKGTGNRPVWEIAQTIANTNRATAKQLWYVALYAARFAMLPEERLL